MTACIHLSSERIALVDQADVERLLSYSWCAVRAAQAGESFYAMAWDKQKKRSVYMHRVILDAQPGQIVDHANGDKLDNRRANLRFASRTLNGANRGDYSPASGFRGVYRVHNSDFFVARIQVNNRNATLGKYTDPAEAAAAYDLAAIRAFGAFARLNFPVAGTGA